MIALTGLHKRFVTASGTVAAVEDFSFDVPSGSLVTLLGPSGCGKTTTLRLIAGLERADAGEISIDGQCVSSSRIFVPANRRQIGMVFQSYAIWPHMTVAENVAFPLRVGRAKVSRSEARSRVREVLELVGLESMADRAAPALSGGQQQRVALARALVCRPKVLLLDEPLSNLDPALRDQMREEIRELQQRLAITSVLVTHDHAEALAVSDQVVVMRDGRIVEAGSPEQIYTSPRSAFTAQFLGVSNQLPATVVGREGAQMQVQTDIGRVRASAQSDTLRNGDRVMVFFRPEKLRLSQGEQRSTGWPGSVQSAIYRGDCWDYRVAVGDSVLRVRAYNSKSGLHYGDEVFVEPDDDAALVIQDDVKGLDTADPSSIEVTLIGG